MVLHATFSFLIKSSSKLLVTSTGIKAWTSSISGLWFPWPIYMFLEMRFDLGTLDSGERLLPFGLLVCKKLVIKTTKFDLCLFLHKMCCKMVWNSVRFDNLMGIGFQMDFISQCEIWHVCMTVVWIRILIDGDSLSPTKSVFFYFLFFFFFFFGF